MSSWLGDYRWTDTDVREGGDELKDLATGWLHNYQGDFEPLLRIKEYYTSHQNITVVQARTVLNCMRGDTEGFTLLKLYGDFNPEKQAKRERRRPDHLRVVPEPSRKYPYELKHTWKKRYLISASKNAKVGHIIRPKHSTFKYYPSQEGVEGSSPYHAWVSTWCSFHIVTSFGPNHGSNRYPGGFGGFMVDDPEEYGYGLCMSCIKNFADRGGLE
jgi:hypothetical protein